MPSPRRVTILARHRDPMRQQAARAAGIEPVDIGRDACGNGVQMRTNGWISQLDETCSSIWPCSATRQTQPCSAHPHRIVRQRLRQLRRSRQRRSEAEVMRGLAAVERAGPFGTGAAMPRQFGSGPGLQR